MMSIQPILLGLTLASLVALVISSEVITHLLRKQGVDVSRSYLRYLSRRQLREYARITSAESGRAGWWLYLYIASICIALGAGVPALLLR